MAGGDPWCAAHRSPITRWSSDGHIRRSLAEHLRGARAHATALVEARDRARRWLLTNKHPLVSRVWLQCRQDNSKYVSRGCGSCSTEAVDYQSKSFTDN